MIRYIRRLTGTLPQPVRYGLRRMLYAGSADRCPLCGNGVRLWKPHGGGADVLEDRAVVGGRRREADSCPICHGKDRTRLMQLYLEREARIGAKPLRVLDFAPEYGLYRWIMTQPQVDYVATDLDARRYRHIRQFVEADITKLPFKDAGFDVVLCSHVLEHVPDVLTALRELRRVLAPGGVALLLVPEATDGRGTDEDLTITDPAERHQRFGQWDHVRLFGREDFVRKVREGGFSSVEPYNPGAEDETLRMQRRLNPDELLRVAHA